MQSDPYNSPIAIALKPHAGSTVSGSVTCSLLANAIDRAVQSGGGWAVAAASLVGTGPGIAAALGLATILGVRHLLEKKKKSEAKQLAKELRAHALALKASTDNIERLVIGLADGTYPVTLDGIAIGEIKAVVEEVLAETQDAKKLKRWDEECLVMMDELPQKVFKLLDPELRTLHDKIDQLSLDVKEVTQALVGELSRKNEAIELANRLQIKIEDLEHKLSDAISRLAKATANDQGGLHAKFEELRKGDVQLLIDFLDEQIEKNTDNLSDLHRERHAVAIAAADYPSALETARVVAALNPDNAEDQNRYGQMLSETSDFDTAIKCYRKAEKIARASLGDRHPAVAVYINNVAGVLRDQEELDQALLLYQEAMQIDIDARGASHPDIAMRLSNIGTVLVAQGKLLPALETFRKAELIDRQAYGDEHSNIAIRMNNIGGIYKDLGKYEEALKACREGESISRKIYGDDHPRVADALSHIGGTLHYQGKLADALAIFKNQERIYRSSFGDVHHLLAQAIGNSGTVLYDQGKYSEALSAFLEAKAMCVKIFGRNHPSVALELQSIAGIFYISKDYQSALSALMEAEAISIKSHGDKHYSVALTWISIGGILFELGKREESRQYALNAFEILLTSSIHRVNDLIAISRSLKKVGVDPILEAERIAGGETAKLLVGMLKDEKWDNYL